jgi:hypothetical protein
VRFLRRFPASWCAVGASSNRRAPWSGHAGFGAGGDVKRRYKGPWADPCRGNRPESAGRSRGRHRSAPGAGEAELGVAGDDEPAPTGRRPWPRILRRPAARHGAEFGLADDTSWPEPAVTTSPRRSVAGPPQPTLGPAASPVDQPGPVGVDRLWRTFLRRFDPEHAFRLSGQSPGWTAPGCQAGSSPWNVKETRPGTEPGIRATAITARR